MIVVAVFFLTRFKVDEKFYVNNLFESTFKITTPFKIKEENLDSPNPQFIDKSYLASYCSANLNFIAFAYKIKKRVNFKSAVSGVQLLLNNLDKQRDGISVIKTVEEKVINGVKFKDYKEVQNVNGIILKTKAYSFKMLVTSNSKFV